MFNFFAKKDKETNHGWFTVYGMEDVYQFLTEKRIREKINELKNLPTLGTPFEDFVNQKAYKSPSGELYFFKMLLLYFKNDLDLAIYLYERSKAYSEFNYPLIESLKEVLENHLKSIDRLSFKYPENLETYRLEKRPIFWLEYDMLYVEIMINLFYNFNFQKFSKINIEGEFYRKGGSIITPEIEIIFKSKRKPKTGNYLVFKSDLLLNEIKTDLIEIEKDVFSFDTKFGAYRLKLSAEKANISKNNEFTNQKISLIKSTDFLGIFENLIVDYISNFDKITERYTSEIRKTDINFLFAIALIIKELNPDLLESIKKEINLNHQIWGTLDSYTNAKIHGVNYPTN